MPKVLIVEDELAYQKILKDSLEKEQFQVILASTVKRAQTYIDKNRSDVILLDIMLPGGINGFDLLEQLKANEKTRNIPVIVITNFTSEEKVAKEIGVAFYIIKSETTLEQIIEKVKQVI